VHAGNVAEREDGALDARDDATEVGCSGSGRSANESTWTRLASQTAPGRLPPTGGWSVQFSSDHTAFVVLPSQIAQGGPPGSPRRGGSGTIRSAGSRGTNGSL
jgi:hypothetical protein